MKKLLSIILALMMALPLLGNACAPVFAAGAGGPAAVQAISADPLSDDGGEGGGDDDVYAEAYGDRPLLTIGEETAVSYDGTEASGVFRFIPEEDGKYTFFSSGTFDTYASLYSASGYQFASNDDGGENGNFCFTVNLIGGETYYLFSRLYSSGSSGTYSVTVKRIIPVKSISLSLSDPSAKLTQGVDSGYWTYYYDYEAGVRIDYYYFNAEAVLGIITVNAVFEDGSEGVINLSDGSYYYEFSYESSEWIAGGDANTFTLTVEGCAATINIPVASYGDQFGELRDLVLDEEIEVNYDGTPESGLFRFIPERDGKYVFTSTGGYDTYCLLRDFKGSQIASNDDGGENGNFRLEYRLEAGKTYYLFARLYSSGSSGDFTLTATRLPDLVGLSLSLTGEGAALVQGFGGYWTNGYNYDTAEYVKYYRFDSSTVMGIITITGLYEDESTAELPYYSNAITYSYDPVGWTAGGENNTVTVKLADNEEVAATINVPVLTLAEYFADNPDAVEGEEIAISYDTTEKSGVVKFTPERDGKYAFESHGDSYTYGVIYDSDWNQLKAGYGGGEGSNFRLTYMLEAGRTYYFASRMGYSSNTGEYTVSVTRLPDITGLSLSLADPDTKLVVGTNGYQDSYYNSDLSGYVSYYFFYQDYVLSAIRITATYEDGSTAEIGFNYEDLAIEYDCRFWTIGDEGNTVTLLTVNGDVSAEISVPVAPYAASLPSAPVMVLDEPLTLSYNGYYQNAVFTPEEDGTYYFYSSEENDPVGAVYGELGQKLADNDDSGASFAFCITLELTAGMPYVLRTWTYSGIYADYDVTVSKTAPEFGAGYGSLVGLDLTGKMINIVFVVDTTGSMGEEIESVRNTLRDFVSALSGTNAILRISLIDYKDIYADGMDSTVLHYNSREGIWYENADVEELREEISALRADGGGDTPESVVDAVGNVVIPEIMTFNSTAAKFVFLLTDADYKEGNRHEIEGMADLIERLARLGIRTSVVSAKGYYPVYKDLVDGTGGFFINIYGDFASGMGAFAAEIAKNTSDYVPDGGIIPVTSITLGADLEIPVGKIRSFEATVSPSDATDPRVVWAVEDTSIATISELTTSTQLVIRGVTTGTTHVIARSMDGGYVASFDLTVSGIVESEYSVESCDMDSLIIKLDEILDEGLHADLIYYSEATDGGDITDDHQTTVYAKIDGTEFSVTFVFDDSFGDMLYSWKFAGGAIEDASIPVDLSITVDDEGSPVFSADNSFLITSDHVTLDFAHEGGLPGPATVSVPVVMPDGVYVLYWFDPESGLLEPVGEATVTGGVASFSISHCSSYLIAKEYSDHEHDYVGTVTEPTCTEQGYTTYVCSVCGNVYVDDYTEALGHNYVAENTVAPTCTEEGYTTYVCTRCGDVHDADKYEALGHDFGKDKNAEKCARCGAANPNCKPDPTVRFEDVPDDAYYAEPVNWAVANGITQGVSKTRFGPDNGCTRGQVVTFLWRSAGSPEPKSAKNPFSDVKEGDYYYKAVLWAVENDITKGMSATSFAPDATCTRGQIVTFLYRAKGSPTPKTSNNPFEDVSGADYYYNAVLWAVENGVTAGVSKNSFAPGSTCTRAQIVTFLYRATAK